MEQFLILASSDEGPFMEIMGETKLGEWIDGSDYLPVHVDEIYVLREGRLVKCEFGDVERLPQYPDPENERSIIYAYSPLFAGDERVASLPLTDH